MRRTLLAGALVFSACTMPGPSTTSATSSSSSTGGMPDAGPGACHVAPPAAAPDCASPPSSLAEVDLSSEFLRDVWSTAGLTEARGWRVTFGDVNGDGFPELFAIERPNGRDKQHLWMNEAGEGGRTFVDRVAESGLHQNRDGESGQTATMFTLADVDNDGDLDVFSGSYSQEPDPASTRYNGDPNEIYLNDGTGQFTRVAASGVNAVWPLTTAAAVFLDYNLDGKLDLFVGNFMIAYPDITSYQDELFLGNGDGTFTRVTAETGIETPGDVGDRNTPFPRATYGATSCDYNDDGWPDILVSAYALEPDVLWENRGGLFVDVSSARAFDQDFQSMPNQPWYRQGGNTFGAACGDYDNDGDIDVFQAETTHGDAPRNLADRSRILRNTGAPNYQFDRPELADTGINRTINASGTYAEQGNEGDHGAAWLDFDNDGLLDLLIEQSAYPGNHTYLFHQKPDHTFEDVTAASGVIANLMTSNGMSVDDFDRDGDLDFATGSVDAVNGVNAPENRDQVHLYENLVGQNQNFLHVTLHGVNANRSGVGARVVVTAGCITQVREIPGGKGTFGAQDPAYAHFGLGNVERIDRLEVRWPTNPAHSDVYENVAVNQFLVVTEGAQALECTAR